MAALHAAALPPGWSAASVAALMETPGTQALIARFPSVRAIGLGSEAIAAPPPERGSSKLRASFAHELQSQTTDVMGFVMVRAAADEAEILTIAVAAEARRRGTGRALLAAAARGALTQGATRLHLEVASNNETARKFYADAGFIQTGRRACYYPDGADALLLSHLLLGTLA